MFFSKSAGAAALIICSTFHLFAQNLISNGGFENAGTGWTLQVDTGFIADVSYPSTGAPEGTTYAQVHVSQVTVTDPQQDNWKVQLQLPNWVAAKNSVYRLAFRARSTANRLKVGINRGGGGEYVAGYDFPLDTQWQTHSLMFISDTVGTGTLRLNFYIGADTGVYEFDSVALEKAGELSSSDNLIVNGGFEFEGAGWGMYVQYDAGAGAMIEYPSTGAAEGTLYASVGVKITHDPAQVQLQSPLFTAEAGAVYTITFKARGSAGIRVVSQGDQTTNYQIKESKSIELTPEWATYSADFTSDVGGYGALRLNFHLGGAAGIYDFDSVFVSKSGMTASRKPGEKSAQPIAPTLRSANGGVMVSLPDNGAEGSYSLSIYSPSGRLLGNYRGIRNGKSEIMVPLKNNNGTAIAVYADRRGSITGKISLVR